jgi:hypothetical protein
MRAALRSSAQEPSTHCKKARRRLRPDCDRLQKTGPDCQNRGMAEGFWRRLTERARVATFMSVEKYFKYFSKTP